MRAGTPRIETQPSGGLSPHTSRRASSRRFHCPGDPCWHAVGRLGSAAALSVAVFGIGLHLVALSEAVSMAVAAGLMLLVVERRHDRGPQAVDLQVDDAGQWWLLAAGQPPMPVTPAIVADLESWMLLRLAPMRPLWRWRAPRFLAVRRRDLGMAWSALRVHLLLSRA